MIGKLVRAHKWSLISGMIGIIIRQPHSNIFNVYINGSIYHLNDGDFRWLNEEG